MDGAGMLFVLPRAVKFAFWYHLGCSGHNGIICSRKGLVRVAHEEIKNTSFICIF